MKKRLDYLGEKLVGDLVERLPTYAHQRFFDFLSYYFGVTKDPLFDNLLQFLFRKKMLKSTDFGTWLMNNDHKPKSTNNNYSFEKPKWKKTHNPFK